MNFLFDLDQTLLDFHATEHKALKIVCQNNGLEYSDALYDEFMKYNKTLWLLFEKGKITRTELFTKRFAFVMAKGNGKDLNIDPLALNDEFINTMAKNGILMDGAMDFVKRLKVELEDVRIYIVTNGVTVNAMGRIRSTGLDAYLEDVFVSEDLGVNKPAKEYFDICLGKISEPKENCIVIGDSLSSDMQGAKNAGLSSVWFMPEGDIANAVKTYDITYTASSFDELFDVLKKWTEK
ncbi:MAG: YjjG family noncanonical pyrimidine nucleotidase [Lachnospiraceae bacterium]|nr:YjjG family noncanonical pyrimidine nucleotidase [Lachnospiraceae bacterium]